MRSLLNNLRLAIVVLVLLAVGLIAGLVVQQDRSRVRMSAAGENRVALAQRYENAGNIVSSDGVILAASEEGGRRYAEDLTLQKAVMPLVGDYTHIMTNTVETRYEDILLGANRPFTRQLLMDVTGRGLRGDDVHLALDAELTRQAYELLGDRRGAVALLNYSTGDVLALASTPSATADEVIQFTGLAETSLFNRALQGAYTPGSTFKVLTSAAWVDSSIYDPAYVIMDDGHSTVSPAGARDREGSSHGPVDLNRALRLSCNVFFGDIGARMGGNYMLDYYDSMGLFRPASLDRIDIRDTELYTPAEDAALVSWFSIGQPSGSNIIRLAPIELASIIGGIANEGVRVTPHLVSHFSDPLGNEYGGPERDSYRMMSISSAQIVEDLMIDSVNGEGAGGVGAQVSGLTIGGKTGTPEIAGQENHNAVFAGFIQDEEFPYAVAVIVEEVGYGATHAAPIARELFRTIFERG